jgi:hypothetical protein
MHDSQAKFQHLLRELFQFDSADLDFGHLPHHEPQAGGDRALHQRGVARGDRRRTRPGRTGGADAASTRTGGDDAPDQADAGRRCIGRRWRPGRSLSCDSARQAVSGSAGESGGRPQSGCAGSRRLQPSLHLLQPLLSGRRLHLQAALCQTGALRHSLQRRGGDALLGEPRPVLRQERRVLHRLPLSGAQRRQRPLQAARRRRGAEQRQGRQALLSAPSRRHRLGRRARRTDDSLRLPPADQRGEPHATARATSRKRSSTRRWRRFWRG